MNHNLDPNGGDIIGDKIILLMSGIGTDVLMFATFGKSINLKGRSLYGCPREILDRNAPKHHYFVVFRIMHPMDCLSLIRCHNRFLL